MKNLPPEILIVILSYLNFKDLLNFSLVCNNFLAITNHNAIVRRFKLKFSKELLREKNICRSRDYLSAKIEVNKALFRYEIPARTIDNCLQYLESLEIILSEDDFFSHPKYVKNFFKMLRELKYLQSLKWESIEEISATVLDDFIDWGICSNLRKLKLSQIDNSNFDSIFKLFHKSNHLKSLMLDCDCHLDQVLWNLSLLKFLVNQQSIKSLHFRWLELDNKFFKQLLEDGQHLKLRKLILEYSSLQQHDKFCEFLLNQDIEYLVLSETKGLNDVILASICNLKNITYLEINICNGFELCHANEIPHFYKLQHLVILKISSHPTVEKNQVLFSKISIPKVCNYNMKELKLQYIPLPSLQEMTEIFPFLQVLELRECNLNNSDLNSILRNLKYLYKLSLDLSCRNITDDCFLESSSNNLRHLTLIKGHHLLTETFIQNFLQKTPNLINLHFEFCINLSNEWIKIASENLLQLHVLKLSGYGGFGHPRLDMQFLKYIQGSKLELKLNFFLYTKFVEIFNILENLNITCE